MLCIKPRKKNYTANTNTGLSRSPCYGSFYIKSAPVLRQFVDHGLTLIAL
ncbi:hypothetical protein HanIR_Chr10g0491661 [Helianthus annuus]|nr:hypothetical protein HanIR_Chr10g0491661 [Helianthus annuus]